MTVSPNVTNYAIGKGKVFFRKEGQTEFRHMGNVAEFEITPDLEELDHFSSMEGVRVKDLTVIIQKSGTLRMLLEEWTPENLQLALLGEIGADSEGDTTIDIMSENVIRGEVRFEGSNQVGPKWNYEFPRVAFKPSGSVSPISDEWGQIEIEGEIEAVSGKFGTATLQDSAPAE